MQYQGGKKEYRPRNPDGSFREIARKDSPRSADSRSGPAKPYSKGPVTAYRPNASGPPSSGGSTGNAKTLENPQTLIRFRAPREKTAFKKELEELQETFRKQAEASRPAFVSRSGGGDNKADFYDKFLPPSAPSTDSKKVFTATRKKEVERKGSEGTRPKGDEDRARKSKQGSDLDEDYDEDSDEDYFGEEEVVGFSAVPFNELRNMDNEGLTLEEMQMTLYGEYGVKVSVAAIKRRLSDEGKKKKGGKTGKTRRDRQKARRDRQNPVREAAINLPESGVIQIVELAGLMDVGAGEVVKHLMVNMGIMASMTQSIDVSVAKSICEAFGKKVSGGDTDEDSDDDGEEEEDDAEEEVTAFGQVVERLPRSPIVTIMGHVRINSCCSTVLFHWEFKIIRWIMARQVFWTALGAQVWQRERLGASRREYPPSELTRARTAGSPSSIHLDMLPSRRCVNEVLM